MANKYPAFKSFSAGEISPRMYARSDLPVYDNAVSRCENFNITPQGSVSLRKGWRYLAEAADSESVRLVTFSRALNEDIILELSDLDIRAYNSSGEIIVDVGLVPGPPIPVVKETVNNGDFANGFTSWTEEHFQNPPGNDYGVGTFSGWYHGVTGAFGNVTGNIAQIHRIRQTVTKPVGTPQDNMLRPSFQISFDPANFENNWDGVKPVNYWHFAISEVGNPAPLYELTGQGTGLITIPDFDMTSYASVDIHIGAYNTWDGFSDTNFYHATQATAVSAKFTVLEDQVAPGTIPWTAEMLPLIQTQVLTGQDAMVLSERRMPVHLLTYDASANRLGLSLAPLIGVPTWDSTTGWPGVCEIFQGRLWLMSTLEDPSGVWGSKSGSPFDFNVGTGLPNEGLNLPIATRGVIQWAVGQQRTLSIGTDLNEEVLTSNGPVIVPSDASVTPVSAYGSAPIQAGMFGDQIGFISRDARKLLMSNYDDNVRNWVAMDLSVAAEHLMAEQVFSFMNAKNPDYQILCSTREGNWIQCMYDRPLGLLGWQRNTTPGRILSMCVSSSVDGDIVWGAIRVSGRTVVCRLEASTQVAAYLDYWARRFPLEDIDGWYIDDLEYFSGVDVTIVIDGAYSGVGRVDEIGVLRLPYEGTEVFVGLPYKGLLVTLPEEPSDPRETYSGGKKRNADITVRIVDSAMPLINGKRPADRSPQTPMDNREPNVTTDINVRSLGWDGQGLITIEQDKPFRTEIVGIFTKLGVNKT